MSRITVRTYTLGDVSEMCRLLNAVIEIGGSTAHQVPFSENEFIQKIINGESSLCCHVALDAQNTVAGFQTLNHHPELAEDWGDIATFARVSPKVRGVGQALFAETKCAAIRSGIVAINATIRADNEGGLAYYEKMGFETYAVKRGVPLADGTPVDRICKEVQL